MLERPDVPDDQVIARIAAVGPRRVVGAAILLVLGALLLWVAVTEPPASPLWLVFLLALGAASIWLGVRLWQATAVRIELTPRELREEGGRTIARIDQIRTVGRGVFAFKPSNGFVLTLDRPGTMVWAPGLWWRVGRRVGVGGVTARHDGRAMAEIIELEVNRLRRRVNPEG